MIIGNGDLASALQNRDNMIFFASGVSNSLETRESEYEREIKLLLEQDIDQHIVYFSSLCVFYSKSRYARHKRKMESIVKTFRRYTIIRLGNITWGTNPHTIINNMRARLARGEKLTIRDEYRYVVDKEEFIHWIHLIPSWSCEINIVGKMMTIHELVNKYVCENSCIHG